MPFLVWQLIRNIKTTFTTIATCIKLKLKSLLAVLKNPFNEHQYSAS